MSTNVTPVLPHLLAPLRVQALGAGFLALVVVGALLTDPVVPDRARLAVATTSGQHRFAQITTGANFGAGISEGVRVPGGSVTMTTPRGALTSGGKGYAWSRWSSWFVRPHQAFTQVIATWNIITPPHTLVQVQARARSTSAPSAAGS